ncbi:unnamed protein product [Moneuplotes crassus]|uniref:Threonylcarbamoyl-AMP synthase n=2 Tax=Euplotes crassus TaxID=5936 RepID=A0AAD1UPC1_EUPCR|nr:unnamed protein product [Moneuplotes crassus]
MENTNTLQEETQDNSVVSNEHEASKSQIVLATDDMNIQKAGEIIRNGGLVSFPTETVYGLGANAFDKDAAISIFTAKERPMTDPLICHIYQKEDATELMDEDDQVKEIFGLLADRFWPGPLTMVVKANKEVISPVITADTGYVGIRCPNHPVALSFIKEAGRPIAAPSANKFGHVSPTKAEHVYKDLKDNNVYIIDGGSCNYGIESTVVKIYHEEDSTSENPHIKLLILRRGGVCETELNAFISEFKTSNKTMKITTECVEKKHFTEESHKMEAPGQFLRHYAPDLPSYMLAGQRLDGSEESQLPLEISKCVFLDFNKENIDLKSKVLLYLDLSEHGDYIEAISRVYDYLRISETQKEGEMVIIADLMNPSSTLDEGSSHKEHSSALADRLFRAVSGNSIIVNEDFTQFVKSSTT